MESQKKNQHGNEKVATRQTNNGNNNGKKKKKMMMTTKASGAGGGVTTHRRHPTWSPAGSVEESNNGGKKQTTSGSNHHQYHYVTRANQNFDDGDNNDDGLDQDGGCCFRCCFAMENCITSQQQKGGGIIITWCCNRTCFLWLVLSLAFWGLLYVFATAPSDVVTMDFTLNVGETWQVPIPPLWAKTKFAIKSTTEEPGLNVYLLSPVISDTKATCPSTTGPVLTMKDSEKIALAGATTGGRPFEYDHFHLNAGSQIQLSAKQVDGTGNIYILRGVPLLKDLEEGKSVDFHGESILKRFSGRGGTTTVHYDVLASDFYTVVYDNPAPQQKSTMKVDLQVLLSTHFLQNQRPICGPSDTIKGCGWTLESDGDRQRVENSCLIVQAVSPSASLARNDTESTLSSATATTAANEEDATAVTVRNKSQVVKVELESTVGSPMVLWIAFIPFLAGLLYFLARHGGKLCAVATSKLDSGSSSSGGSTASSMSSEKRPLKSKTNKGGLDYTDTYFTTTNTTLGHDSPPLQIQAVIMEETV